MDKDEAEDYRQQIEVLTRTTEILARRIAGPRSNWAAVQNAAHTLAQEAWNDAHSAWNEKQRETE